MGLFDNFFRGIEYKKNEDAAGSSAESRSLFRGKMGGSGKFSGLSEGRGMSNMLVFTPNSYEDVQTIIDHLKNRESVILSLKDIKPATGQRIIDFLSGAIYALSGSIFTIENGLFLLAPDGVNIMTQNP